MPIGGGFYSNVWAHSTDARTVMPQPFAAEDDGVLLSVVFDSRSGRSFMLVLDAADLSEVARAEAPHHIPYGFHGQFLN